MGQAVRKFDDFDYGQGKRPEIKQSKVFKKPIERPTYQDAQPPQTSQKEPQYISVPEMMSVIQKMVDKDDIKNLASKEEIKEVKESIKEIRQDNKEMREDITKIKIEIKEVKESIKEIRQDNKEMREDITKIKIEMVTRSDMEKLAQSTKQEIEKLDNKIDKLREGIVSGIRWMIGTVIAVGGLVVGLLKYWH